MLMALAWPSAAQIKIGRTYYIFGPTLGDHVAHLADEMREGREVRADFESRIQAARERYWATYPNGEGFAAAEQEFRRLLLAKDLMYLNMQSVLGFDKAKVLQSVAFGGDIDGGIPKGASRRFSAWVVAFVHKRESITIEGLLKALEESQTEYLAYARERDLDEFLRAGRTPPGFSELGWYLFRLIHDEPGMQNDEALEASAQMLRHYGDAELSRAVEATRAEADSSFVRLRTPRHAPPGFGDWEDLHAFDALMLRLADRDRRSYLFELVRRASTSDYDRIGIETAEKRIQHWIEVSGEDQVLLAAERIAAAEKTVHRWGEAEIRYGFDLRNPSEVGCESYVNNTLLCLRDLLDPGWQDARPARAASRPSAGGSGQGRRTGRERSGRQRLEAPAAPEAVRGSLSEPAAAAPAAQSVAIEAVPEVAERLRSVPEGEPATSSEGPVDSPRPEPEDIAFDRQVRVQKHLKLEIEPDGAYLLLRGPSDARYTLIGRAEEYSSDRRPHGLASTSTTAGPPTSRSGRRACPTW